MIEKIDNFIDDLTPKKLGLYIGIAMLALMFALGSGSMQNTATKKRTPKQPIYNQEYKPEMNDLVSQGIITSYTCDMFPMASVNPYKYARLPLPDKKYIAKTLCKYCNTRAGGAALYDNRDEKTRIGFYREASDGFYLE